MRTTASMVFVLLVIFCANVWSIDGRVLSSVDAKVVMVVQQVSLDPSVSTEVATWKILEAGLGKPVLGTDLTISSGTGFFLDAAGHLLTNQHVTDVGDESRRIKDLVTSIQNFLTDDVSDKVLTPDQKFRLRIDIARILKPAKIVLRVVMPSGSYRDAKVLSAQEKVDLALVQASVDQPTIPLLISPHDGPLTLGVPVAAVGYPMPDLFDSIFDQKRLTVTQGNVSALRDNVWAIQHTAALNPGNSGGPLLDEQGTAVGVNVGLIRNANGLFFAIDLRHVNQFLQESGHFDIWQANQALSVQTPQMATLTQKVVGDTVILNSEKGTEIFQDQRKIGVVPFVMTLTSPTTLLRFQGATGEASVALIRDQTMTQTMTVDVPLRLPEGSLSLTTNPIGAIVSVDGVTKGKTPFNGPLTEGNHLVQLKLDGYTFDDRSVRVDRNKTSSLSITGAKLYQLVLSPSAPPGTKFTLTNGSRILTLVDPSPFLVPEGRWTVGVENPDYLHPVTLEIDTDHPLGTIDSSAWFEMGTLEFRNVAPGTTLFVDGSRVGPIGAEQSLAILCGSHEIKLQSHQYFDFASRVKVVRSRPTKVVAAQQLSAQVNRDDWAAVWGWSTLGLSAVSIPSLVFGLQQYQDAVAQNPTRVPQPNILMSVGGYGLLAASISGIFFYVTLTSYVDPKEGGFQ